MDIVGNMSAVVKNVVSAASVDKDVLKAINGTGYVGIVPSLLPGTEYQLVVYASNGYESNVIVSESSVTTTGDPLPIYEDYSFDDVDEKLVPAKSDGYFGKYNFYAVNKFGKLGIREYISKVTISDSSKPDSEPDEDGIVTEYVDIKGIFNVLTEPDEEGGEPIDFDDTMVWECYDGILYSLSQDWGAYGSYWTMPYIATDKQPYTGGYDYLLWGGFVADGYIAIVPSPAYVQQAKLEFTGIAAVAFGDAEYKNALGSLAWYSDLLFVAEGKDDNGVAPTSKAVSGMSELHAVSEMAQALPFNCVETRRGHIRSIIDAAKVKVKLYGIEQGFVGERTVTAADFSVSSRQAVKAEKNGHRINGLKIVEK